MEKNRHPHKKQYSFLIADDHPLFRRAFAEMLRELPGTGSITEASDGEEVLRQLEKKEFDFLFLDIEMPAKSGLEVLHELRKNTRVHHPYIFVVSSYCQPFQIIHAFDSGINGYLLKNTSVEEVRRALRVVMGGEQFFSREISDFLFKHIVSNNREYKKEILSGQEKKVLEQICQQYSNTEIAGRLFLSEKTVKRHRYNIKEKIGARNTVGLVLFAIQNGYYAPHKGF